MSERRSQSATPEAVQGPLVLVVEDEANVGMLISRLLTVGGFVVETLDDGDAAVDRRFREPTPALIVMNWLMPRMNGDEAIRLIRQRERAEGGRRVRIILESGSPYVHPLTELDIDGALLKPFSPDELIDAVVQAGLPLPPRRPPIEPIGPPPKAIPPAPIDPSPVMRGEVPWPRFGWWIQAVGPDRTGTEAILDRWALCGWTDYRKLALQLRQVVDDETTSGLRLLSDRLEPLEWDGTIDLDGERIEVGQLPMIRDGASVVAWLREHM